MQQDDRSKTTLKNLLEEMEDQNLKYELVLQAAGMGVFEWDIQSDELLWDKRMFELYKMDRTEKDFYFKSWLKMVHLDDQKRVQNEIQDALDGKKPFNSIFRAVMVNKKLRYIKAMAKVIRNDEGKAIKMIGLHSNITDSIIKNNEIQKLTNDLMTVFDAIPGLVIHKSLDDTLVRVNKFTADEMNTTVEEMIGKKSEVFWGKELSDKFAADDKKVIESKKPRLGIIEKNIRADGSEYWVRTDKVPYFEKDNQVTGVVLCAFDITDEINAKNSLERLNEELTQFAYRTSHDLKAPLATIRSLTQIISEDLNDGNIQEVKDNIKRIEGLSIRLETLVSDMLDLTKADFIDDKSEVFNFEKEINEIKVDLVSYLETSPTEIILENNLTKPIKTNTSRIRQILENLISNGVKYSNQKRDNPFVKILVEESDIHNIIKIMDNGIGIPKENSKDVFTMFKRFHKVQTGSGLGLSLVKKHIEAMQGQIKFESGENGTIFSIYLPK